MDQSSSGISLAKNTQLSLVAHMSKHMNLKWLREEYVDFKKMFIQFHKNRSIWTRAHLAFNYLRIHNLVLVAHMSKHMSEK